VSLGLHKFNNLKADEVFSRTVGDQWPYCRYTGQVNANRGGFPIYGIAVLRPSDPHCSIIPCEIMALTIGTQLGSHEITALLGKGGMGEWVKTQQRLQKGKECNSSI
jgi:hypothetical protein